MNKKKSQFNKLPGKILYVNLEGAIAGAEKSLLLIIKHLKSEYSAIIVCPRKSCLGDSLKRNKFQIFSLPEPPRKFNKTLNWLYYYLIVNLRLLIIVFQQKPNVIHANSTKAVLAAILSVFLARVKLIWHVRDTSGSSWIFKLCSMLSSKTLAVSHSIKMMLVNEGIASDSIFVVYNAVEIQGNQFRPATDIFTFANIGQFVPWKNQEVFIEAAERFLRKGFKGRFMLIGKDLFGRDGVYARTISERIKQSPYSDYIQIVLWQEDMSILWEKIDCLVHTAEKEPFGRVIIEAMERRVPVIAANMFGPSEIIKNNVTGLLYNPLDKEDLTRCMEDVFRDTEKYKVISAAGYQYVCNYHNVCHMMDKIHSFYDEMVA